MAPLTNNPILWADPPKTWPAPPEWMSFYRLREAERCPRRAALKSAGYPDLWRGHGYPPRLRFATVGGQVVHSSVRTLGAKLAQAGCRSALDPPAVGLLKELGGLSRVLTQSVDLVYREQSDNPRATAFRRTLFDAVRDHVPQFREQVQVILSRLEFEASPSTRAKLIQPTQSSSRGLFGSNCEVELRVPALHWVGIADYIGLSENGCEIIDFKSGSAEEDYALQIRLYALLWARDRRLNPEGRLANRLTLSYKTGAVNVPPPSETELDELEQQMNHRSEMVRTSLAARVPEARPSRENCRFCDVRHLCSDYWNPETQRQLADEESARANYTDIEVTIVSQQAMKCWKTFVTSSRTFAPQTPILLRTSVFDDSLDEALLSNAKAQVRVLDAHLVHRPSEGSPSLVTISESSEAFLVR
jgi:PD-(D/E)XK nuclease superfamily